MSLPPRHPKATTPTRTPTPRTPLEAEAPMTLWHATTPKKLDRYKATGGILPPVRGWRFEASGRAWAQKTNRTVLLRIDVPAAFPLPDHQPPGHAWWHDGIVREWTVCP